MCEETSLLANSLSHQISFFSPSLKKRKNVAPSSGTRYYFFVNIEFILIAVVLLLAILLAITFYHKKKLPRATTEKAIRDITATEKLNPAYAIIETHKIFVFTLATLINPDQRKKIKAVDVIKKFAKRMPNEAQIWKTHRLRNRIAHEPNINISATHADLARRDLIRALRSLSSK